MKCPICNSTLRPGTDRCPDCGYHCGQNAYSAPASAPRSAYTPPNAGRKRTGCFCCLALFLPVLLFTIGALLALSQLVVEEFDFEIPDFGIYEEEPSMEVRPDDLIPESIPSPADDSCFVLIESSLMFVPENWDGGPILNIPEYVDGQQVTTIGPGCFTDCDMLTTILLPDSVTVISPKAFSGCTKLRGLYIPDGVETIGKDAFEGCIDMEALYVPASVTYIAEHCFDDCASLLYLFYDGSFEDWDALYSCYINPYTTAICLDGSYYHGSDR